MNVALATLGTVAQAVIQMASDPATAAANPWLAPLGVVAGAVAGHEVNRLAARVDRAQARRAATHNLLVNEHLARALAIAIERRLTVVAETFGDGDAAALREIAHRATDWWPQLMTQGGESTKGLDDRQFTRHLAEHLTGRQSDRLTARDWRVVLDVAASFIGKDLAPHLADAASEALAAHFMDDAVEALKMDFAHDGEAFARISLTFFAEIFFEIHDLGAKVEAQTDIGKETLDVARRTLEAIQAGASALDVRSLHEEAAARQAVLNLHLGAIRDDVADIKRRLPSRLSRVPTQFPRRATGGALVGRQTLRSVLADRLRARFDTDIVGPAGYGKTAVAAEAIRDVIGGDTEEMIARSVYPDGVVLLDLYTLRHGDLNEAWSHLAHSFGAPELQDQSPHDRARQACLGKRALVIVEGAEEAGPELGALLAVLNRECVRLVLTRDPAQATIATQRLDLIEELTRAEASELLNRMCPGVAETVVTRVYAALDGHPLALTWAGAALTDTTADSESLLNDLAAAHLPTLHEPGYETHTLAWLYERGVRRLSDDARRVLGAIGSLAHGAFPLRAIEAVLAEEDSHERSLAAIRALARAAIIVPVPSRRNEWTISHALAYRFGRGHHKASDGDVERLALWCAKTIESAMSPRTDDDFDNLRAALRHAEALLTAGVGLYALALLVALLPDVASVARLGSVDIARTAVRSAAAWLDRLPEELHATAWAQRQQVRTYVAFGDVAINGGDLGTAQRAFEAARRIVTVLAARDPADMDWQRAISVSENRIGDVLVAQGDGAGALAAFRRGLTIDEALAARDSANTEWQRDVSISENRIGEVLVGQGDGAGALAAFRRGLAIAEALAARDPTNITWQRDLAVSHQRIGLALVAQGDRAGALAAARRVLKIIEALAVRDPTNTELQRDLSVSEDKLGDVLLQQGDRAGALAAFRRGLAIREALAARDPANTLWQRDLSYSCTTLATHHEDSGDYVSAIRFAERSLEIDERLSALDPTNAIWQKDVRFSRAQVARLRKLASS